MYQIRARNSDLFVKRQGRQAVEISASGQDIPLQDWRQRWYTFPQDLEKTFKSIYEFEVKDDDVFVVTFPKCGTTWAQEAAWLLLNDLDYAAAQLQKLMDHLSFDNMKANKNTNLTERIKSKPGVLPGFEFMRRGVVGAYKDELSLENQQKLDKWTEDSLKGLNIVPEDIFGAYL